MTEERRQKFIRQIQLLRPIDDVFVRCLFKDNIPLVQLVLRIITGIPNLVITKCPWRGTLKTTTL